MRPAPSRERVVAVVVAWNRAELLTRALAGIAGQLRRPDLVLVIDNASTDGSAELARGCEVVDHVITLPTNTGGAGGFAAGIAVAVQDLDADLVWIMDDDTVPTPEALSHLLATRAVHPGPLAVLASRADWTDGREHPMNAPRSRLDAGPAERRWAEALGARPIRSASFVSILIDAGAVRAEGLPVADYFLWNDDFEYTCRLLRHRQGLYVPASRVLHLTSSFGDSRIDPGQRFVNEVRNKVWLFTRSGALAGWERAAYGAATLRRWTLTILGSGHRVNLLGQLREGLLAGLARGPRATTEVLAGTPVAGAVAAVERGAGRD